MTQQEKIQQDKARLCEYIDKFVEDKVVSTRSVYYHFPGFIIRISDHIGTGSSGIFSIIALGDDQYLLHRHNNGKIKLINYRKAQELIRYTQEFSEFIDYEYLPSDWQISKNELTLKPTTGEVDKNYILGVHLSQFTPKQFAQIQSFVRQTKSKTL